MVVTTFKAGSVALRNFLQSSKQARHVEMPRSSLSFSGSDMVRVEEHHYRNDQSTASGFAKNYQTTAKSGPKNCVIY